MCLFVSMASAAEYVGTMRLASGYTLDNVRATIDNYGNLTLYQVKFARLMPVRIDVVFPKVKLHAESNQVVLSGDSIVPKVNDKPHPDRLVTEMQGRTTPHYLFFKCMMGTKQMQYEGKSK